jgi:hypothetical protein
MALGVLSKLIIIELFLLFVQFWFGMINNLFAVVPLNAPFSFFVYTGGLDVLTHIVNGSIILSLGLPIIWFSYKTKKPIVLALSVLAIIFVISAIINGILFLEIFYIPSLYNIDNYFSFAMAISFLSVFTVLFLEMYVLKETEMSR